MVGFGLAVFGFVLAGAVWIFTMKKIEDAEKRELKLQAELKMLEAKSKTMADKAKSVDEYVQEIEKALADAVARRDEKAMATAMWDLELERSYRQWRDVIVPSKARTPWGDISIGQQLAFAIAQEVERLRDEVGVSITFDGGLDLVTDAEVALGVLRISEELLALAAKKADEVTVSVDQGDDPSIVVALHCEGWSRSDDDPATGELGATISSMAGKLDGWIRWETKGDDNTVVTVSVPAPLPTPVEPEVEPEAISEPETASGDAESETQVDVIETEVDDEDLDDQPAASSGQTG